MAIPLREKQSFYHSLAQLLRAGIGFPSAVQKIGITIRGPLRIVAKNLLTAINAGQTVAEAFGNEGPAVSPLEISVISATEKSGALERGFTQLALYFETLARARESLRAKLAYPLFILHFGILVLGLPSLVARGWAAYLKETLPILGIFYALAIVAIFMSAFLRDAGSLNPPLDRFLRRIPLFGKVRAAFAHARFCLIYGLKLEAGINIMDALESAAETSRSGLIHGATRQVLEKVRAGSQVGSSMAETEAFPDLLTRSVIVGEESGQLDRELRRLAADYQEEAVRRMELATLWSAKIITGVVMVYLGWRVIEMYLGTLKVYDNLLDL